LGLQDPDPLTTGTEPEPDLDPDPSIIKQKWFKKTLISTVCDFIYDFLSLKTDVNVRVPSNSKKKKLGEKKIMFC
jgi:hypothetical protein